MTRDRWKTVRRLFREALTRAPPDRIAFLRARCGGDVTLLRDLAGLLEADERARDGRFLRDTIRATARDLATRSPDRGPLRGR